MVSLASLYTTALRGAEVWIDVIPNPEGRELGRGGAISNVPADDRLHLLVLVSNTGAHGGLLEKVEFTRFMRFEGEAMRLERDCGLNVVEWPQSQTRMTRCSENLHRLVTEGRLRHHGDPELDRHVADAVAQPTPRGWRLVKSAEEAQIDGVIALAMSAERAVFQPEPVRVLGWV